MKANNEVVEIKLTGGKLGHLINGSLNTDKINAKAVFRFLWLLSLRQNILCPGGRNSKNGGNYYDCFMIWEEFELEVTKFRYRVKPYREIKLDLFQSGDLDCRLFLSSFLRLD